MDGLFLLGKARAHPSSFREQFECQFHKWKKKKSKKEKEAIHSQRDMVQRRITCLQRFLFRVL